MNESDLAPPIVLSALAAQTLGRPYVCLPECTSTNDEVATRAAKNAAEGLLIAAETQTSGRGRRGRAWHSPGGENLYFSLLLRPPLPAAAVSPLTLLAGAALGQTLARLGFAPRLKWPNDLLLDTAQGLRKVAGILTEMASEAGIVRHVVLGVGINVNGQAFPDDLNGRATSLRLVRGQALSRGAVLATFINAFEPIYRTLLTDGPQAGLDEWRNFGLLGQACVVERTPPIEGVAVDVDASGALVVRRGDGTTISVHSGEVNWQASR